MADDLDDFFAKKDKKKTKKGKIANSQLAKKLEKEKEAEKKKEKKKEKPEPKVEDENSEEKPEKETEEWAEFEEEKEVDYTGLKIQKLEISESPDDDEDYQREGEEGPGNQEDYNPWKVSQSSDAVIETQQPERPPRKMEEQPEEAPKPTAKYVPPQHRGGQTTVSKPKGLRSKVAPDINNQDAFPSLHTSVEVEPSLTTGAWGRKSDTGFESVRHGSRTVDTSQDPKGPKLNLGNIYSALQDS